METNKIVVVLACVLVVIGVIGVCEGDRREGGLRRNFYKDTCPNAEQIVKDLTEKRVSERPNLPAKLLRLHFHDCFVRGCDGSVLLNSTAENSAERDALFNKGLEGFDVIDEIKAEMEAQCPGVVSCADILALAARDAVSSAFDGPLWQVLAGRRDGTVSRKEEVSANIPSPFFNLDQLKQNFAAKKLSVHDLIVLSGAHTIGRAHCNLFSKRVFNFSGNGDEDPSLNSDYAEFLKSECRGLNDVTTTVEMDPGSSTTFDTGYYSALLQNEGLFTSDAALLTDDHSRMTITHLVREHEFLREFAKSMQKLAAVEVLTGQDGQIRTVCGLVNS
ncbi:hypothetical protein QN277_021612 [Acacia crassicarpa]|uniref:Peroxidase n=1 Tax=Acacia crassicarpa TaxID=499986 RepID=A0AAE1MT90_9FABA|nr:hypothetical protein QN277_021612 [Acacia crassicarpa]